MPDFISREAAIEAIDQELQKQYVKDAPSPYRAGFLGAVRALTDNVPAADVEPIVRCGKDRLTKLGRNGVYCLAKVKDNEQEVDSPYRDTLAAIVECLQRLAEYENAEFGEISARMDAKGASK